MTNITYYNIFVNTFLHFSHFFLRTNLVSSSMKINAEQFWREVEGILIEDGLSINELAKISGLEYKGLAKLRDGITKNVQHATMRKIAEATGRKFTIIGDSVTFTKIARDETLSETAQEIIKLVNQLNHEQQQKILQLVRGVWEMLNPGKSLN